MSALLLFASTFVSVFALGLQSQNVNQGHYWAAAGTSVLIGTGHIFLYKFMPDASLLDAVAYYVGGVLGITASMWFHRIAKAWWNARREQSARGVLEAPAAPQPESRESRGPRFPLLDRRRDEHADIGLCGLQRRHDDIN